MASSLSFQCQFAAFPWAGELKPAASGEEVAERQTFEDGSGGGDENSLYDSD